MFWNVDWGVHPASHPPNSGVAIDPAQLAHMCHGQKINCIAILRDGHLSIFIGIQYLEIKPL
jgi:hypothetical protein